MNRSYQCDVRDKMSKKGHKLESHVKLSHEIRSSLLSTSPVRLTIKIIIETPDMLMTNALEIQSRNLACRLQLRACSICQRGEKVANIAVFTVQIYCNTKPSFISCLYFDFLLPWTQSARTPIFSRDISLANIFSQSMCLTLYVFLSVRPCCYSELYRPEGLHS